MPLRAALIEAVRSYDAEIARLQDYGLDLKRPGAVAAFLAAKEENARKYAEELRLHDEIDRVLLPEFMTGYITGTPEDRQEIRGLLKECRNFRWALGRGESKAPADPATDLRRRLTLFSMRDGDPDWRDEILTLDWFCAAGRNAALDVARLLHEAAELSSDMPRGHRASTRATLLERADKIAPR